MSHILVVEDDEHVRKMLQLTLERAGHSVQTAVNGEEGIKLQRLNPADLMIVDMIMPVKDGAETIREARLQTPDLKIIAISGGTSREGPGRFLGRARQGGALRFFTKPFGGQQILIAVEELLSE